jgi:hypothetical protein
LEKEAVPWAVRQKYREIAKIDRQNIEFDSAADKGCADMETEKGLRGQDAVVKVRLGPKTEAPKVGPVGTLRKCEVDLPWLNETSRGKEIQ